MCTGVAVRLSDVHWDRISAASLAGRINIRTDGSMSIKLAEIIQKISASSMRAGPPQGNTEYF